jgi:hypothetical protein
VAVKITKAVSGHLAIGLSANHSSAAKHANIGLAIGIFVTTSTVAHFVLTSIDRIKNAAFATTLDAFVVISTHLSCWKLVGQRETLFGQFLEVLDLPEILTHSVNSNVCDISLVIVVDANTRHANIAVVVLLNDEGMAVVPIDGAC